MMQIARFGVIHLLGCHPFLLLLAKTLEVYEMVLVMPLDHRLLVSSYGSLLNLEHKHFVSIALLKASEAWKTLPYNHCHVFSYN